MTENPRAQSVEILIGGSEWIDSLEPLWLSLFDHHKDVGPGPFVDRTDSWPRRRHK